jgi:hypothetical protein
MPKLLPVRLSKPNSLSCHLSRWYEKRVKDVLILNTLVRAASALMPTLTNFRYSLCSQDCEHGTHECVRHIRHPNVFFIHLDGQPFPSRDRQGA